jgi:hypothetical protein
MTTHSRAASVTAAFCALFALGLFGCGGGDGSADGGTDEVADVTRAAKEMQDAVAGRTGAEPVEPVDFRELKDLLPEEVVGWKRVSHEGQRSGAAGFTVSTASALYQPEDRRYTTINIELIDTGGLGSLGGLATVGMATWLSMEVDRETDSGYERTREYNGYPAYETFMAKDGEIGSAQLNIVVERRFVVQLNGADVRMEDVMSAADELDLERLADLSKQ